MNILHKKSHSKGFFYIGEESKPSGQMTYTMVGEDLMIIDHTEVGEELKGQGAGKELVKASVEFARKNNIKILPLCPFAKATFKKTPEYADVLSDKG